MVKNKTDFIKRNKTSRSHLVFAIISALLISLLVIFATYLHNVESLIKNDELGYTHLNYTDELTIQLLNIETGARGYLLSSKVEFLEPFYKGTQEIKKIQKLVDGVWPNYMEIDQVAKLEEVINLLVSNLSNMVQKNTSINSPESLIANFDDYSESKNLMDDLRLQLADIRLIIQKSINDNLKENLASLDLIKWAILLLSVIAFSLLYIVFTQAQRQQKTALEFAEMIAQENQNLESKVNERTADLMSLASYMTSTNEEEKKRIARELHDELGALLTAARMDASWIDRNLKEAMDDGFKVRIDRLINTISQGIKVKRNITNSLVPPLLRELGLTEAINALTEDLPDENPPVYQLELSADLNKVDDDRALAVYRICQESLTNIRKYANAKHVLIKLTIDEDLIKLVIKDDGKGFELDAMKKGTHGLAGMNSRAAMFGGTFKIESKPDFGTKITADLPLSQNP